MRIITVLPEKLRQELRELPGFEEEEEGAISFPDEYGAIGQLLRSCKGKAWVDLTEVRQGKEGNAGKKDPGVDEEVPELKALQEELERRRYSRNTIEVYSSLFKSFRAYLGQYPTSPEKELIDRFLLHLVRERKSSASTQNQAINAIKFYYEKVMGFPPFRVEIPRPKKEKRLPAPLSKEKVAAILKATPNLKHRAILTTIYASGLRIGELLVLRPEDIDASRMLLRVRGGKGKIDRVTLLSTQCLKLLRAYYREHRPKTYLFESPNGGPYSAGSIRKLLHKACSNAGVQQKVTPHDLRHSFATHLLEAGTDIRYIQALLGHGSPKTTEVYTYVAQSSYERIESPMDDLEL